MFDNVVLGASHDEATLDALALAKTLARDAGNLTLVHVEVQQSGSDANGTQLARGGPLPEPLLTLADDRTGGAHSLAVVTASSVAAGLHEYADRAGADLLVVGSSKRDRFERAVRRDTKHAVLDDPPCAVAVAPAGYAGRANVLRTIGVGYDGSLASEAAVATARTLAVDHNARLSALEAVPPVVFAREPLSSDYHVEERVAAARERVGGLVGIEGHAEYGSADSELSKFGATVDLLVLGPHEPDEQPRHGASLSQRVADDVRCALLVLALPRHPA